MTEVALPWERMVPCFKDVWSMGSDTLSPSVTLEEELLELELEKPLACFVLLLGRASSPEQRTIKCCH